MWDQRYAVDKYIYGTEPNSFLAEHAEILKSPVLSLAEGEGRNAVFLASLGLKVHGVDGSNVGLAKAQALARSRGVEIQTEVADLEVFEPAANYYGSVVSIFAHLPSAIREKLYPLIEPIWDLIHWTSASASIGRSTNSPLQWHDSGCAQSS